MKKTMLSLSRRLLFCMAILFLTCASGQSASQASAPAAPNQAQAVGTHHMFDSTPGSIWPSKGDGPPFLYWTAKPGIILAPGRYEVRDSDPASWSSNQETDNRGVAWVYGIVM